MDNARLIPRKDQAASIMAEFAKATGLSKTSASPEAAVVPRRYLWTDAFAVCNYLALYQLTKRKFFLRQARALVHQVHQTLGKHRTDGSRGGWLSGLTEKQATQHPTQGGLRIGKPLNERGLDEPTNQELEWDQDGQYFHYLTKWMHALLCVSKVTGEATYLQWALELAKVAHTAFIYAPSAGSKRIYWKMSIDLSRPLITSQGQHDPLDGLVIYLQLSAAAKACSQWPTEVQAALGLSAEINEITSICAGCHWVSHDALGIGGLLIDTFHLLQLIVNDNALDVGLLEQLMHDLEQSLRDYAIQNQLNLPAQGRLAFRELGLAIGLQAIPLMQRQVQLHPSYFGEEKNMAKRLSDLSTLQSLHKFIQTFWLEKQHQQVSSWQQHRDINRVMLATSLLAPEYLQL